MRFVLAFGVVSCLADFVYEGARAIVGPFLANLGASALVVGFVTGVGEAVALVLRLGTGRLSDRTGRHWALSVTVYVVTVVAVPLLALTQTLWQAAALVVAERFGKAVRTPARDTMLAQASSKTGRGWAFALHEALDQSGAVFGPLVVAGMVALCGYRLGFGVLAIPGVATVALLAWLRRAVPVPTFNGQKRRWCRVHGKRPRRVCAPCRIGTRAVRANAGAVPVHQPAMRFSLTSQAVTVGGALPRSTAGPFVQTRECHCGPPPSPTH
ncbi:MAG: MFS transporter [Pseudonocardiaceae bacterium]